MIVDGNSIIPESLRRSAGTNPLVEQTRGITPNENSGDQNAEITSEDAVPVNASGNDISGFIRLSESTLRIPRGTEGTTSNPPSPDKGPNTK